MIIWITSKKRKDGKFNATCGFDNGVRIKKVFTEEKIKEYKEQGAEIKYH